MTTNWNSNSNNNNSHPETVDDYITLLTAVKEKYGNLKVRRCNDGDVSDSDEYCHFEDIVVNQESQSLIHSGNNTESYLVFVG